MVDGIGSYFTKAVEGASTVFSTLTGFALVMRYNLISKEIVVKRRNVYETIGKSRPSTVYPHIVLWNGKAKVVIDLRIDVLSKVRFQPIADEMKEQMQTALTTALEPIENQVLIHLREQEPTKTSALDFADRFRDTGDITKGIGVEVGTKQVAVDVSVICKYDVNISEAFDRAVVKVKEAIRYMTGLDLVEFNMNVDDVMAEEEYLEKYRGKDTSTSNN
ncbi:hypothetical protein HW555_014277 [Spodoptera exigua]|uniref:Uncharacterized protein n=1 Tax=Spodoptera exigua TaxID=7107 RepID=A0A835G199_SPOEX|nr:hypothetical protein HW555_014277 [Spodoptera exigua]